MYYRLQLLAEHVDGRRFEFSADYARDANLRVGAHPDCDLVLTGREVSSFHLSLSFDATLIRLIDLGSSSGVWFDDERLHSKTVHRETHCRLGPYTLSITVQTAGLGEPIQSAGDLEVAQWLDGQIIHVDYIARQASSGGLELAETRLTADATSSGWLLRLHHEGNEKEVKVESETVFEELHPFLYSFRQVESWQPKLLPKQDRPSGLWLSMALLSFCLHAAFAFGLWLTPAPAKETSLVALEDANRFAKLFLEDIRNAQPVDPPVVIPQEPVKPIVLPKPKPEPVVEPEPEPETVKVRKKRRAKRRQKQEGLAEAMASLGGDFQTDGGLLNQLGPSVGSGPGNQRAGKLGDDSIGFDDWLSSMKVDEQNDAEVGRRYQARIEGQIAARKGELRTCLARKLLKKRGEIRVEVSWRISPAGRVENVRIQTGLQNLPRLSRCLERKLLTWQLAVPPMGESVELTFPVVFRET